MANENTYLEKIAKSAFLVIIGVFISKLFGYVYNVIIARIGTEEYGLFSTGMAIIGVVTAVSFLGLQEGVVRYMAFFREKKEPGRMKGTLLTAIYIAFFTSIAVAILLFLLSDKIALGFFHNARLGIILKILAISIPLDVGRTIFLNAIKSFEVIKYDIYVKQLLENILRIGIAAILVYMGMGVVGATIAHAAALFVGLLASFYFLEKKVYPFLQSQVTPIFNTNEMLSYSIPLLLSGFMIMLFGWTDTLMLGHLRNASEVGIYNAANATARLVYMAPFAISIIFVPIATALYARGAKEEMKEIYQSTTKWVLIINLLLLSFIVLFSKNILSLLFGNAYSAGGVILLILSSSFCFMYLLNNSGLMLRVIKHTKLEFITLAICVLMNIILNYILITKYGLIGAAIATAIASIIVAVIQSIAIYLLTGLNPFNRKVINVIFSAIVIFFPAWLIVKWFQYIFEGFIPLLLAGIILAIAFGLMLLITKSLSANDLYMIKRLLKMKKINEIK